MTTLSRAPRISGPSCPLSLWPTPRGTVDSKTRPRHHPQRKHQPHYHLPPGVLYPRRPTWGSQTPSSSSREPGESELSATRRHGDLHPERFNMDFFFRTETWAPGFPSLPPLKSSITETVEFTHGPLLQPDDLWAGSRPLFRLAPTPTPLPLPGVWQSLATTEGMATPPHDRQPQPVTRHSPHPHRVPSFWNGCRQACEGMVRPSHFSLDSFGTQFGQ